TLPQLLPFRALCARQRFREGCSERALLRGRRLLLVEAAVRSWRSRVAWHARLVRPAAILAHGERDAVALHVDLHHAHLHDVAGLHHLMRVLHKAIRKLGDVHQTVLMDTDIHERAKGGDVGDCTFELHAGPEILNLLDTVGESCRLEGWSRIAARLFQFGDNVLHCWQAEALVDELARIDLLQHRTVTHDRTQVTAACGNDLACNAIGFGVDR